MQITISSEEIKKVVSEIMKEQGYVPEESLNGKTIGIKEFAKKYCCPHGTDWVKSEIFYKFHPDWVLNIHPGSGQGFTIFEKPAAEWMEKHRDEVWRKQ